MLAQKFRHYTIITIVLVLTIIIYPLTDNGGLYLPLVYFMYLSPALIILLCYNKFKLDELLLWCIIPLLFLSAITAPERFRISTVVYSSLFIVLFILFKRLLSGGALTPFQYQKLLKFIIAAYFVTLVAQQVCFIFNFPIVNINFVEEGFKLNSLAYEASYVAAILPLLMLSLVKSTDLVDGTNADLYNHVKKNPKIWIMYLYTMFTCGASTVFFTFPVFLLYFFKKKASLNLVIGATLILGVGIYLITLFNPAILDRQTKLIPAILSLDSKEIIETDRSASTRIIPVIELFNKLKSMDPSIIFGYGVDYSKQQFSRMIVNDSSRAIGAGGMTAFIIDYGLIVGIIFTIAVVRFTSNGVFTFENFFYLSCFFIFGFNSYLTWSYMIFMYTNKYFFKLVVRFRQRSEFRS